MRWPLLPFGLCAVLLWAPASFGQAATPLPGARVVAEELAADVVFILRSAEGQAVVEASLGEQLAGLGPERLPDLFSCLVHGQLPELDDEPRRTLNALQKGALSTAFKLAPKAQRDAFFADLVRLAAPEERVTGLWLLGSLGSPLELELLIGMAGDEDEESPAPRQVLAAYSSVLGEHLAAQEHPMRSLQALSWDLPTHLWVPSIQAIAKAPPRAAMHSLARLLMQDERLDALLLFELRELGRQHRDLTPDAGILSAVRRALDSMDLAILAEAVQTTAEFDDGQSVSLLIDLLEHPSECIRAASHQALMRISGHVYGADQATWKRWHLRALTWWQAQAEIWLERAQRGSPAEVAAALNELSGRGLFRSELGFRLDPMVHFDQPQLIRMACAALGRLRARSSLAALQRCLEHPEPSVRAAALAAMEQISKQEAPPRPRRQRTRR